MSDLPHDAVAPLGRPEPGPLHLDDPPKVGDFWLDARLMEQDAGVVYIAHRSDEPAVMLLMLKAGAAADAAARDRLAGEVNKLHADVVVARGGEGQDDGRLAAAFRSEADDPVHEGMEPLAPWVALAWDGSENASKEAERLLRSVDLSATPSLGTMSGPDFDISWRGSNTPGTWRVWPLPGPGRHDRAGAMPLVASWALMITLAGLALLIAVLLFQNTPPQPTPPPVDPSSQSATPPPSEQSGSPSDQSASPSDQSASPSEQSGSPSEQSASPSEDSASPSEVSPSSTDTSGDPFSPSQNPSMGTSGTADATHTQPPTAPNTRL